MEQTVKFFVIIFEMCHQIAEYVPILRNISRMGVYSRRVYAPRNSSRFSVLAHECSYVNIIKRSITQDSSKNWLVRTRRWKGNIILFNVLESFCVNSCDHPFFRNTKCTAPPPPPVPPIRYFAVKCKKKTNRRERRKFT